MWQERGLDAITMIREPVERFASAFEHARDGTDLYRDTDMMDVAQTFANLSDFVTSLMHVPRNATRESRHAWELLEHRERGQQFRAQSEWLDGDMERTHVSCYSRTQAMAK